ncbi:hypothetical protein [Jiangella anatolica]|uniref:Uncharacterized protein n=1 Tax=Jiangella anatolica TaxID=2670374 RepID=A0A2W2BYQ5_9ACTN|nr:hypothetical protein [Jiangella anatolica]PZF85018.1 hypothetical protein C1I92_06930 [Jiangella anatolica]
MTERTENLRLWIGNWFDDSGDPDGYVEGCNRAPEWLDDPDQRESLLAFRDELAAHIRDSSLQSLAGSEPQWNNDEWHRNLYYDLFGPEAPPGDPYPVPPEDWGHRRQTPYLFWLPKRADRLSEANRAWLAKRGLTHEDRGDHHRRPEPPDYQQRLERLTREGARQAWMSESD